MPRRQYPRQVHVGYAEGWRYARDPITLPPGAVAAVRNILLEERRAVLRPGTELAYTNDLSATSTDRIVDFAEFDFPSGQSWLVGLMASGAVGIFKYRAPGAPRVTPTISAGGCWKGSFAAMDDAIFLCTGNTRPMKFVVTSSASEQWAGCWPLLFDPDDDGIPATVADLGAGASGLGPGHYWYAVLTLYGPSGRWGVSSPGSVGQATVPGGWVGEVTLDVPILGDTVFPSSDARFAGAWGRWLVRTQANGSRNGPYYFVAALNDVVTEEYVDRIPDSALSGVAIAPRFLTDDTALPPMAQFCCLHEGRMVYAGTIENPNYLGWSEVDLPDVVYATNSTRIDGETPGDGITGVASFQGALFGFTRWTVHVGTFGAGATFDQLATRWGCAAPKSLAKGRGHLCWMSDEGPMTFRSGVPEPLGGEVAASWVREWLEDHCSVITNATGIIEGDYYYLGYGHDADEFPDGAGTSRVLRYSFVTNRWAAVDKGYFPGAWSNASGRLLFAEGRRTPVILRFNRLWTDWNDVAGTYDIVRPYFLTGNMLPGGDEGLLMRPERIHLVAAVQGDASNYLALTPIVDGVRGTAIPIYRGAGSVQGVAATSSTDTKQADVFRRKMVPDLARVVQFEIAATANINEWALYSLGLENRGDRL